MGNQRLQYMKHPKTTVLIIVATLLLSLCIAIDAGEKQDLWDSSASFQQDIQTDSTAAKNFFSFVGTAALVVTAVVQSFYFFGDSPELGMNLIIINAIGFYLPAVLKMIYSDPRPYWVYDDVQAIKCSTGWGNPSGHALYTGAVWMSVMLSCMLWKRFIWVLPIILWVLLIGFDRLYLGVHFYSQVVLGWSFGLFVASLHGRFHTENAVTAIDGNLRWKAVCWHILAALLLLIGIFLYLFRDPYWDPKWSIRILEKCKEDYTLENAKTTAFIESALVAFIPAASFGVLFSQQYHLFSYIEVDVLWKKGVLILVSFLPLALQGGIGKRYIVLLLKSQLMDKPWVAWAVCLAVSYAAGLLFTAGVPYFAKVVWKRGILQTDGFYDGSQDPKVA